MFWVSRFGFVVWTVRYVRSVVPILAILVGISSCTAPDDVNGRALDRTTYQAVVDFVRDDFFLGESYPILVVDSTHVPEPDSTSSIIGMTPDDPKFEGSMASFLKWRLKSLSSGALTPESVPPGARIVGGAVAIEQYHAVSTPSILYFFSPVVYGPRRRNAVAYYGLFCGSLCGRAGWVYLEVESGEWVVKEDLVDWIS